MHTAKILHENPWFKVRSRNGYFTVEYNCPQVIILPTVENHSIVMVRVNRPVISDSTLELPAGGVKDGEQPIDAAIRELNEETGIAVKDKKRFRTIPSIAGSPNRNPELLNVFQVELSSNEVNNRKDHDQEIDEVEILNFDEVRERIVNGTIYVAVPIAVISRYFLSVKTHI